MRRVAILVTVLAAATPAAAIQGWIQDENDRPIQGATACIVTPDGARLCDTTADDGYYELPSVESAVLWCSAEGYLPIEVAAVDHEAVVLERAASFLIRLIDADSGEPVGAGKIWIVTSSGARKGPLPVNRAGLHQKRFRAGQYRIQATAEGYEPRGGVPLDLVKGKETALEIRLTRSRDPDEGDDGG